MAGTSLARTGGRLGCSALPLVSREGGADQRADRGSHLPVGAGGGRLARTAPGARNEGIADMGLFDTLKGVLSQAEAAGVPQMLQAALAKTSFGNLQGVLNQLQASGLGSQVQSWLGNGAN